MGDRRRLRYLGLLLVGSLGACGSKATPDATGPATNAEQADRELSPKEIIESYKPAIVRIENRMDAIGSGVIGTGFIVDDTGRIATNLHVVAGPGKLSVKLSDDSEYDVTEVVAFDAEQDLALLQIQAGKKLPTVPLGDSDLVQAGEKVIAIGNPFAFDYTVSDGLISSVRKGEDGSRLLQITAPISQGSSGGPLFNSKGQVVGVATKIVPLGQNLNFGVPVNALRPLLAVKKGETPAEFAKRFARPKPPSEIKTANGVIKRDVPEHDIALLDGCTPENMLKVYQRIQRAIDLGAPLYNEGNHEACFDVYSQTAGHFTKDTAMCSGVRQALQAGLDKSSKLTDPTAQAWAMRDTFDGLLRVIVLRAQAEQRPSK